MLHFILMVTFETINKYMLTNSHISRLLFWSLVLGFGLKSVGM